jgi:hypothetical protein
MHIAMVKIKYGTKFARKYVSTAKCNRQNVAIPVK